MLSALMTCSASYVRAFLLRCNPVFFFDELHKETRERSHVKGMHRMYIHRERRECMGEDLTWGMSESMRPVMSFSLLVSVEAWAELKPKDLCKS